MDFYFKFCILKLFVFCQASRSAIMNFFRIPLNLLVVLVLVKVITFYVSDLLNAYLLWRKDWIVVERDGVQRAGVVAHVGIGVAIGDRSSSFRNAKVDDRRWRCHAVKKHNTTTPFSILNSDANVASLGVDS
jgi:hypothetical protein